MLLRYRKMMRIKLLAVFVFSALFVIVVTPALAEDTLVASSTSASVHHEIQSTLKSARAAIHQTIQQDKDALKATIDQQKQQLHNELQVIKDQHKQQVVENINSKIIDLNAQYTTSWTNSLTALQTYLTTLKGTGTSSSASANLSADIATAQTDITTAQTAVTAQAGKTYTIQVISDATLHSTVGKTVSQFRTDLMKVHMSVMDARLAVLKVATDLGLLVPSVAPLNTNGGASPSASHT